MFKAAYFSHIALFISVAIVLGACAAPRQEARITPVSLPYIPPAQKIVPDEPAFYKISTPIQCVPHARQISGIPIRGNAHTWWSQAAGKYKRSNSPAVGSVMVLSKTSRLRYGHLAVVKRIIDSRNIEVEHANWGGDRETRRIIYTRMPERDSSKNNVWSSARFWHYPSKTYGKSYKVSGFIFPNN